MALFDTLKKIFSQDVVVRNIGGKKLKVIDTDQIEKVGYKFDKFNRLFSSLNTSGQFSNSPYGMEVQRLRLFQDYEAMDTDAIIASALDIYSEESCLRNEFGDMITIKSSNGEIKEVLENLFYDILNIEFNLPTWIRSMCKYGDCFLKLDLSEKYGVVSVIPLSVYQLRRSEGEDINNPSKVYFYLESSRKTKLENFEIAHFRLLTDPNFLPYGRAMIEPARRTWKQLILLEDAMLIHRIMRAPERRIFKIDVGNIAPNEVDAYMQKVIGQIKKIPYIDPETGEYNLKFNLQNMTEDFYLPVRGSDSGTNIDTLQGLGNEGQIEDVDYLKNKLMAALKVPRAFLGYEEAVSGKATLASEDIRFGRTIERIQKVVISELAKIALIHLYIQGYRGKDLVDFDLLLTTPSIIYEQEKLELWGSKISLARDAKDIKLLSSEWIYKNIFNMDEDEMKLQRQGVKKDTELFSKLTAMEQNAMGGSETGEMGGTMPNSNEDESQTNNEFMDSFTDDSKTNIKTDVVKVSDGKNMKDFKKDTENKNEEDITTENMTSGSNDDGRDSKKIRTRTKDEPFGEDPIGKKDYENILRLDGELNYDSNKKKHLSRRLKHKYTKTEDLNSIFSTKKVMLKESDLTNIKKYFDLTKNDEKGNK